MLDKEIVVCAYRITDSKYGEGSCLKLQVELDGEKHVLFTGSNVLIRQCEQYADRMPFLARIVKPGKYYTFQ